MIIFAQDRKTLIDASMVTINKNIGGKKDEKYFLIGWGAGIGSALSTPTLGKYPDEKTAMDELEKIYAAFEAGAATYSIK